MNVKIKYFGLLAEITQCSNEVLVFSETTISELLEVLYSKYPSLRAKDFQVAQHLKIVSKDVAVSEDEISLLPPFSGG